MDKIKSAARLCYKLLMFKGLLPAAYRLYSAAPVIEKKAVFIEVRLPRMSNNFTLLHDRLTERGWDTSLCCLRLGSCGAAAYIKNCLAMIKEIARAQVIFINDGSTVVSSLPIRRETTMIQTWHACGAFKKFGMSNVGSLVRGSRRERELFPMCRHMDYISVSSDEVKWAYREAFDVRDGDGQTIVAAGVSRTDVFFQPRSIEKARAAIGERFPEIGGRKIILYAPTFRGDATDAKAPDALDVPLMCERLGSDYVLLIKQHPLTGGCGEIPPECHDFAFDAGDADINELLLASDICISDYSSLVFEYSLLSRPMIFFTYDMDNYVDWHGFYYPFEEFCPGEVVTTTEEIVSCIEGIDSFDMGRVTAFREKFMSACDGHSTDRILSLMDDSIKTKGSR